MVKHTISVALAGLIALNFGSPVSLLAGSGDFAPAAATGALALATDPLGAGVYVDGVFAGQTPVSMNVPAGDHRVRFVKNGYLENSRIVSVGAERATRVQVRLTRMVGGEAARPEQVQVAVGQAPSGGGRSMLPWLLAGAGGGFVGGYLYQKSKTEEAPANRAPTVGAATATPQTALMTSNVTFAAAGPSDADGDPLTFNWNFGDSSSNSSVAAPTHQYATAGTFSVSVTVGDGKGGSSSASTTVTVKSLTGTWTGSFIDQGTTYNTTLVLTQTGANITGSYSDQINGGGGVVTGTVAATGAVQLNVVVGSADPFIYNATAGVTIDSLAGTVAGSGISSTSWPLSRQ